MAANSTGRWPFPSMTFEFELAKTALLIIDMQYFDAHPDYAVGQAMEAAAPGSSEYYFGCIRNLVIPQIQRLLVFFRSQGACVMYTASGSAFKDGRDRTPLARAKYEQREKHSGRPIPLYRGSFENQILPELKPEADELVIRKTTASAFVSSNLDQILRNMEIESLIITGVVTDGCVESTARGASDRGYKCIVASDACAAHEEASQCSSLHTFGKYFGRVQIAEEIIRDLT